MQTVALWHAKRFLASKQRIYRVTCWLLLLVLGLQILGGMQHKHALTAEPADCVSCYLAAHVPPPPLPPATNTFFHVHEDVVLLSLETFTDSFVSFPPYHHPFSQAPPLALFSI